MLNFRVFHPLDDHSFVVGSVRSNEDVGFPFTRITIGRSDDFDHTEHRYYVADIFGSRIGDEGFGVLFETGEITFDNGKSYSLVQDPAPTVDFPMVGRLLRGKEIGRTQVVVGDNGRAYISDEGRAWRHHIPELLDNPFPTLPDIATVGPEEFFRQSDAQEQVSWFGLGGSDVDDICLCGGYGNVERKFVHWDGSTARSLLAARPEGTFAKALNDIAFERDEHTVWVCGAGSALLRGTIDGGFQQIDGIEPDLLFYRLTIWRDAIWLAGNDALYRYQHGQLSTVPLPEPAVARGLHSVAAVKDVLWVCSLEAVARFDGTEWTIVCRPSD